MADLYSYIACRMFSAEHMLDNVLDLVERGAGVIVAAKREMYAAVRKFAESIDTGLDVCDFILECEFRDSRKRAVVNADTKMALGEIAGSARMPYGLWIREGQRPL